MTGTRTHAIAVIPGDGIGREVIARRARGARGGRARARVRAAGDRASVGLRLLSSQPRPHDARRRARHSARHDAIYLGAVGRPARARPRDAVGPADPDPPGLRPVREPAAGPAAARRARPAARRHGPADIDMVFVRENTEGEYSASAGGCIAAPPTRSPSRRRVHPPGHRARHRATPSSCGARSGRRKVTRPRSPTRMQSTRCRSGTRCSPDVAAELPGARARAVLIDALRARLIVLDPRRSTWSSPRTCSATSSPTSARPSPAASASPRGATSNPERRYPSHVRAGPRLGARHRRPGHRQPDRRHLVAAR